MRIIIVLGTYTEYDFSEVIGQCDILMVTENALKAEALINEYINMQDCGGYDSVYLEYHDID